VDTITKQAIGFGLGMALIFGAGTNSVGIGLLLGVVFGAGFYAARKRKRST